MRERERERREHEGAQGAGQAREHGDVDTAALDEMLEAADRAIGRVLDGDSARFLARSRQHGGQ